MRLFFIVTMLLLGGCGYSSEQALGPHAENSTTFSNLSSVITGSVTTGTLKQPTAVAIGYQYGLLYLDNEFFLTGIVPPAANRWIELNASLADGKTLYSFFNGTPIRRTSATITTSVDWHGANGTKLEVAGANGDSTVSINPFSNLAYWVRRSNFIAYTTARNSVNAGLNLPPCRFERQLCPEHLAFLQSGNNVYATKDGFVRTFPDRGECRGTLREFPLCQ